MNNSQFPMEHTNGSAMYVTRAPQAVERTLRCEADGLTFDRAAHRTPLRPTSVTTQSPYGSPGESITRPATRGTSQAAPQEIDTASKGTLLDVTLPILARIGDKEETRQTLGITIRSVTTSPHSSARMLCLRVTDPSDPFLLFELELREEDYTAFRQRMELRVDFLAFPKYLVTMLQAIADETSPCHVSFLVSNTESAKGVLRILEATEFKTVEHVSLVLLRQGDVGQKKYLAERFQFFEQALMKTTAQRDEESQRYNAAIKDLQQELAQLAEVNGRLQDELKVSKTVSEKNYVSALAAARDAHAQELQQVREGLLREIREARDDSARAQARLTDDMRAKDEELRRLRDLNRDLESAHATLRSKLSLAEDKVAALEAELASLRESNSSLTHFKIESTRAMSENELNYVSVTERLRAATKALKDKEDELQSLRAHYQKQDDYIRILSTQNDQMQERCAANEKSLEKSHHIIGHQLETIKSLKERYRIASDQISSKDALLQERQLASQRMQDELAASTEKGQALLKKNSELKAQLERTDAAQERLSQELKQSQAALLHLQRSTSVNGRHWGVFTSSVSPTASAAGRSALSGSQSGNTGVYSQFARHATVHAPYTTTSASALPSHLTSTAADREAVPSPSVNLFRTHALGQSGGLNGTVAQPVSHEPSSGTATDAATPGLRVRTADTANRMPSSSLSTTKDVLRAKSFLTEDVTAATNDARSAYF